MGHRIKRLLHVVRPKNAVGITVLPSLTGFRFLAAASIAIGHILPSTDIWGIDFRSITGLGMPMFFTLSGFIIHYVYSHTFVRDSPVALPQFAIARFSRLFPLYWALLAVYLLVTDMGAVLLSRENWPLLIAYITGTTTWWPLMINHTLLAQWYYGISWSVATEIFFYCCYAAGLWRIALIRSMQACAIALAIFIMAAFALTYVLFISRDAWEGLLLSMNSNLISRTENFDNSAYRWLLYISPYTQIMGFIAGVLSCQLFLLTRSSVENSRRTIEMVTWAVVAAMLLLWILFCWEGARGRWLIDQSMAAYFVTLHLNMLFVPACCALIYLLAIGGSSFARMLSTPVVLFLGEISYSIYLGHPLAQGVTARVSGVLSWFVWSPPAGLLVVAAIAGTVVLATCLYFVIEVPGKRALKGLIAGRRVRTA